MTPKNSFSLSSPVFLSLYYLFNVFYTQIIFVSIESEMILFTFYYASCHFNILYSDIHYCIIKTFYVYILLNMFQTNL